MHTSAASSRLNWRPCRFKWNRPFRHKMKSGFCACAITFQLASTACVLEFILAHCCFPSPHYRQMHELRYWYPNHIRWPLNDLQSRYANAWKDIPKNSLRMFRQQGNLLCIICVLFSTKCCSFRNFFLCSNTMFIIKHVLEFKYRSTHVNIKSAPCLGGHGHKVWTDIPSDARNWLDMVENNCTVKLDVFCFG